MASWRKPPAAVTLNTSPTLSGRIFKKMSYYVYVLRSINFERNYVGFTKNLHKRLKQHNLGRTKSTKPFKPWKILFFEVFNSKEEALIREKFLKTGKGREYIKNKWPRGATE